MPRQAVNKNYFTFVKGLITEAGPLTFPENASLDEDNFVLSRDGSRQRRQGIDYESGFSLSSNVLTSTIDNLAISVSIWNNVNNNPDTNFLVIQIGTGVHYYLYDSTDISANKKSFTTDLTTYEVAGATSQFGESPIQTTVGNGRLIIVSEDTEIFMVEHDPDMGTITETQIDLKIRDFIGIDDGFEIEDRPISLTDSHEYNLKNQGWHSDILNAGSPDDPQDPIEYTNSQNGWYPSNSDIWFSSKNAENYYSAANLEKFTIPSTPAPKGHYILDAFNKDRETASGISGIESLTEDKRPTTTEFFAGRVWYSGVSISNLENLSGAIYYSQLLGSSYNITDELGACHQGADPTAEAVSDLIATDGGVIYIPESGVIYSIIAIQQSLLVFADNGIWQIGSGPSTSVASKSSFSATEYSVNRITGIGVVNTNSIVRVEGTVFYWSDGGIYVLTPDKVTGNLSAQNISSQTIQSFYNEIPNSAKDFSHGVYDQGEKKVYWFYSDDSSFDGVTNRYKYNRSIIFDLTLQSFNPYTIEELDTYSPFIAGVFRTSETNAGTSTQNMVEEGILMEEFGDQMIISVASRDNANAQIKYLVVTPQTDDLNYKYTFAELNDNTFYDWLTADITNNTGISFSSFLDAGYEIIDDAMRDKQALFLFSYFDRTETGYTIDGNGNIAFDNPSSCQVQTKWEWSDHENSGRWGTQFQAYRLKRNFIPDSSSDPFNYGFPVVVTKSKLRGKGRALNLRFESEAGKDMKLLGWSIPFIAEVTP